MQVENHLKSAYQEAFRLAAEKLALCDATVVSSNSGATFDPAKGAFRVDFFGSVHEIIQATGAVTRLDLEGEVPVTEKALILHYLIHAKPSHLTGRAISFMEVPGGGSIYCPSFKLRAIDPMVKAFANRLEAFAAAAAQFGGTPETMGDRSYTLKAFPLVPISYVVWAGDDELPASGTILFDASVADFLPVEDIVLAASFGTYRMVGAASPRKEAKS
ncbi:DUF3786 domain-containing protein [Holophaga foetida]|uniref:DUF3786 domain-containing protein n=1 Tax=Holophaga foetida TaxID=35839 RepID=UPI000247467D|nr:DUF3786 domain-containing protein [Holophaga foetida]